MLFLLAGLIYLLTRRAPCPGPELDPCADCPVQVMYPGDLRFPAAPLPPRQPEVTDVAIALTYCVTPAMLERGQVQVTLKGVTTFGSFSAPQTIAEQSIPLPEDAEVGNCLQLALSWPGVCTPTRRPQIGEYALDRDDSLVWLAVEGQDYWPGFRVQCGD